MTIYQNLSLKNWRLISVTKTFILNFAVCTAVTSQLLGEVQAKVVNNSELNIGITQEFESLNPLIISMVASSYMRAMVTQEWVRLTPEGKWVPLLAKRIPTLENGLVKKTGTGKDAKLNATWEIADKASWGDGKPVTCEDLLFSFEVGKTETVSIPNREPWKDIESITYAKETPTTCVVQYKNAKWTFYRELMPPLPKHIEEPIFAKFKKQKEGYDTNTAFNRNATNPGLYSGAYVITELKLGSHVSFAPNPHFNGIPPKVKKITVKYIPNNATLEANLRSGNIDLISVVGMPFDQAIAFEKKVKAESLPYQVLFKPGLTYEHIDLNLDNPILKDVRVRKALLLSINREELVKFLFDGRQQVAVHNLATIDPWFTSSPSDITIYPFSRKDAEKLLDEAGWVMGSDKIRAKDGKKLSLQFITTAGNKTRETVQTYLQDKWKRVGIEVILKTETPRTYFGETTSKRKYEALAMYAWSSFPEQSLLSTLHSKSIPSEANGWAGQNYPGWRNSKVDQLIEQIDLEFDAKKRVPLARQVLKQYTEDLPAIPLYYRSEIAIIPSHMKGFEVSGHQFYDSYTVNKWDLGDPKIN